MDREIVAWNLPRIVLVRKEQCLWSGLMLRVMVIRCM